MSQHPREKLVTAYHEAGHAVGACFLGVPFDNVSIDIANEGQGSVLARLTIAEIRQLGLTWENAVVAMLGKEAEQMFFGHTDRQYLDCDAVTIARLYLTFFKAEMSCQHFRAELRTRTAEIVSRPGFRDAVDALARVVVIESAISQSRAIELIQSAVTANRLRNR